ncbi:MAG: acetyltransferase ribosomal protein [Planctomycetota bacterium]|nr:MAG: acetyltransferase ribosomal protein [Planctomycetota bacterium]
MSGRPTLSTQRLWLSPANTSEAQALQSLWNEPDVRKFLWDDQAVTVERAREAIEAGNASFRARGFGLWCVNLRHSGVLAGFCGLREFGERGEIEILFGLGPARTGLGYATEAVHTVLAHAFGVCGLATVWGRTDEPNARSIRVLEKLGMKLKRTQAGKPFPIREYALAKADFSPVPPPAPPREDDAVDKDFQKRREQ